jgi:GH15 family glucan-1,4-alpha-glucosidase
MPGKAGHDRLLRRSVELILEQQDRGGAYNASPSVPAYRMSWLRDGAFIADAMSRTGERASAEAYFRWVARVVEARAGHVEGLIARHRAGEDVGRDEHLHARYTRDGREGREPWSNHQLDGWGMWLWAVGGHVARHGWDPAPVGAELELVTRYVAEFWSEPCYDWWEERWGHHVATLASAYGGLQAAAGLEALSVAARAVAGQAAADVHETILRDGVDGGRLVGRFHDPRVDASLVACATPFRVLDPVDPVMDATVRALEAEIAHGGVHRYPGDSYYGGGEWLLLAALLGWWAAQAGRYDLAREQLEWVARHAVDGGALPEQVSHHLLVPDAYGEWLARWGPPPVPLLWSHAWFLTLALELGYEVPA